MVPRFLDIQKKHHDSSIRTPDVKSNLQDVKSPEIESYFLMLRYLGSLISRCKNVRISRHAMICYDIQTLDNQKIDIWTLQTHISDIRISSLTLYPESS